MSRVLCGFNPKVRTMSKLSPSIAQADPEDVALRVAKGTEMLYCYTGCSKVLSSPGFLDTPCQRKGSR